MVFCVAVRLFCAPWAYCYIISGAGVVSGTPHPAYEIRIYLHCSLLRALKCLSVQAYKTLNSCGEGLLVNLFGVSCPHWIKSVRLKSALARTRTRARTIDPN